MSCLDNSQPSTKGATSWVPRFKPVGKRLIVNALFLGGALLLGQGFYMDVKAKVAQMLIAHSWQKRAAGSPPPKPWWWADTNAIAKLEVSRLNKTLFVMQDNSGESLAFGPGHLSGSADVSAQGHVMVAGHRDSHFKFLQHLSVGDIIKTTNHKMVTTQYRVKDMYVLNSKTDSLMQYDHNQLTLITCYPFNGLLPGGPLRYIVDAQQI